ncbi:MAG: hypothetical protein RLZZ210_1408 [Pseudomonadota bacterium]|jgi:hypothetical protein
MIENFEIINSYTRKQAIKDGVLHDVSETAQKAGFKIPIAITDTVWQQYVAWTSRDNYTQTYQDQIGRLWDILFITRMTINAFKDICTDKVNFKLNCIPRDNKSNKPILIELKFMMHGGDEGEPVGTIMLVSED